MYLVSALQVLQGLLGSPGRGTRGGAPCSSETLKSDNKNNRIQRRLSAESALPAGRRDPENRDAGAEARSRPKRAASRSPQLSRSCDVRRCSCDQLGLDCGYAGPTIAGVEAAGAKSS